MAFHNNLSSIMKSMIKSHEDTIRAVCAELEVHDQNKIDELVQKLCDTSFSSVKAKKDPNRVKKPKSAYLFFCADKRKEIQEKFPEKNMGEVSKVLGSIWQDLSQEDKAQYVTQREVDIERYENEK